MPDDTPGPRPQKDAKGTQRPTLSAHRHAAGAECTVVDMSGAPHRPQLDAPRIHAFRTGCTAGHCCRSGSAQTQIPRMFTTQLVLGPGLVSVGEGEGELVPVPGADGAVGVGLAE